MVLVPTSTAFYQHMWAIIIPLLFTISTLPLFLDFFPLLSLGHLFLAVGFLQCISSLSLSSESQPWYTILLWLEGPGISSAFSLSSWFCKVMVCPGIIFLTSFLHGFDWDSLPIPKFSWSTLTMLPPKSCSTISFKCSFELLIHFNASSLLRGEIPLPQKPLTIFSAFVSFRRHLKCNRKCCFRSVPFERLSLCHSFKRLLQHLFIGPKTAKSNGWHRCVEFGTNVMKQMFLFKLMLITSSLKCNLNLSPIIANGPSPFKLGTKPFLNHFLNVHPSNQSESVQSKTEPLGPPLTHPLWTNFALYTTIGSNNSPAAFLQIITEADTFECSIFLSKLFLPLQTITCNY